MTKTAVITGGSRGIGRSLVEIFAKNGYQVISCSRNVDADIQQENVVFYECDLSTREGQNDFIDFVRKNSSRVDILINNTGLYVPGQIHNEADGTLEKMIETNLYSAYHVTRGLIDPMIKNKKGHIFNICSTASIMPYINGGSYCISKYAMYGMTKVLREEMKEHEVKVTAILPGATFTSSFDGTDFPEERLMKPEDVSESVYSISQLSFRACVEELILRPQLGDL